MNANDVDSGNGENIFKNMSQACQILYKAWQIY